ncbi:MAG: hypothetical protein R3C02_05665 [Planctomycetaceae bacterium]
MNDETRPPANEEPTDHLSAGGERMVDPWRLLVVVLALLIDRYRSPRRRSHHSRGDLSDAEKTQIEIFNEASPSVVHITTSSLQQLSVSLSLSVPKGQAPEFIWAGMDTSMPNFHVVRPSVKSGGHMFVTLAG